VLLRAYRDALYELCELDIVTSDPTVAEQPGVRVHRGLRPNTPELKRLFADANLFVLPTQGDASPFAVLEALASGLPVVTTNVGAIGDMVDHGVHGHLIAPNDAHALAESVRALLAGPQGLQAMGRAARQRVTERFDAVTNYARLVQHIRGAGAESAPRVRR
jgi:glycosyltransferase involved in cell wall biosynthesis